MRLIVLADLPVETRHERKVAREFKEALHKDGFTRLQENVYTRVADGRTNTALHKGRIQAARPEPGMVRLLILTERQFRESIIVSGVPDAQETEIGSMLDIFL